MGSQVPCSPAASPAWHPVEVGVQQICYLLSQSVKPGANQAEVLSQLDQCRAFPDFNNYLAFIFAHGIPGSGGTGDDLRLAAGLLLKNNLRQSSSSPPPQQRQHQNPYVSGALLDLLFPGRRSSSRDSGNGINGAHAFPPSSPLPKALRSAAAAAVAALVGGGSSRSDSSSSPSSLGDWPELLDAMLSALEGRAAGGTSAAAAAVDVVVAVVEDSPSALSTPPLSSSIPTSMVLPNAPPSSFSPTPLDALVPRLVALCRPGVPGVDKDARCGAAEALNLIVASGVGVVAAVGEPNGLDLAPLSPSSSSPPCQPPLAPAVEAALPRLAAALFDLLSDTTCARGRKAGAAGLVQLVALAPGTLAVGPAASALVAAFVAATADADDAVALEAAEMWPALADVAPDSPPLRDALPLLLPTLLKNMVYADDDDEVAEAERAEAEAIAREKEEEEHGERRRRSQSGGEASCSTPSHSSSSSHFHSLSAFAAHDPTRDAELAPFNPKGSSGRRVVGIGAGGEDDEDENDDSRTNATAAAAVSCWNLRKASAAALDVLATTFGDELLPLVTPSIRDGLVSAAEREVAEEELLRRRRQRRGQRRKRNKNDDSSNGSRSLLVRTNDDEANLDDDGDDDDDPSSGRAWREREAAVLALGAVAEGCGPALAPHLPDLASLLLPLLGHRRPLLRSIACWALSRYCRWLALSASGGGGESGGEGNGNAADLAAASNLLLDAVLSALASAAATDRNPRVQEAACSGLATLVEEMGAMINHSECESNGSSSNGNASDDQQQSWFRGCQACDADRALLSAAEASAASSGGFFSSSTPSPAAPPPVVSLSPLERHSGHRPSRLRAVATALSSAARRYGRKPARMLYDAVATLSDNAGSSLGREQAARAALVPALLERLRAMAPPPSFSTPTAAAAAATGEGDREILPLFECLTAAAAAMGGPENSGGFSLSAGAALESAVAVLSRAMMARERSLTEAEAEAAAAAEKAFGGSGGPESSGGGDSKMFDDDDDDDGSLAAAAAAAASAAAAVLLPPSGAASGETEAVAAEAKAAFVAAAVSAAASSSPERDFVVGSLDLISAVTEGMGRAVAPFYLVGGGGGAAEGGVAFPGEAATTVATSSSPSSTALTRVGALLLPALLRAADDPDADVRQSAFALAGDLARSCPSLLMLPLTRESDEISPFPCSRSPSSTTSAAIDLVALATEGISPARAGPPEAVSAANNAAWALGEVAVALPSAVAALAATATPPATAEGYHPLPPLALSTTYSFSGTLPLPHVLATAADRLSSLLRAGADGTAPRSLLENAAISLGRLSLVAPTALAPRADAPFVARWCRALRNVADDVEKEHAFLGLAALLRANPAAGAPPAFASLCEAITSWNSLPPHLLRSSRPRLAEELSSLMRAYRAGAGPHAWGVAVAALGPGVAEKLSLMCGV